jgi:hypothetical protein
MRIKGMNTHFYYQPLQWKRTSAVLLFALTLLLVVAPYRANAQDQDDPPSRVARLGYMDGSVSFQPAGENDWVEAVPNRPMTTGDKLWVDHDSRAEVQLGSATLNLGPNTGFSFLNLDDVTVQIQITAGEMNLRVRDLQDGNIFEVDTPNQAFTVNERGRYRVEASEDGSYTVITIRQGSGESTGNGQSYTLHAGQRTTFSGTTSLNAEVEQIGSPDDFDNWADARYRRYDDSPSARYCSREMVGYNDMDDNGDWRPYGEYGNVWFPRVEAGWAPYHNGHWAWIDPWGWTWVDDASWGYAPFHYGRWVSAGGRWGWIPGPVAERPVYAPALVVFVGGGGPGFGGNVAWFALGPREVYVPTYQVSQAYVNRVNISNTTVNVTQVTNVYNTTIINKTTTITNVTYVNRNVQGAVAAMPQRAFASAQPVARNAVAVNAQQIAAAPVTVRAAIPPGREAVLGAHANTAGHVAAPPQAIASRAVIAKAAPPPAPPAFAARQQALAQHPGEAIPRQQLQKMAPPATAATAALVKRAPPAKPATATPKAASGQPGNQPANRPGNPPAAGQPAAGQPPATRPQPNQPQPNQPANNRPEPNQPGMNNRPQPNEPGNHPEPNQPPARADRPSSAQPNNAPPNRPNNAQPNEARPNNAEPNRPQPGQPIPNNRPEPNRQPNEPANRPENAQPPARNDRPSAAQPNNTQPNRPQPAQPNNRPETNRPQNNPPVNERPQTDRPPAQAKPAPPPKGQPPKPQTPEEKKQQEEKNRPPQ